METGGRPDCGVCAAVDVHYLSTGGARAAAVLAADAAFAHLRAERARGPTPGSALPAGRDRLRELPPLRAVLDDLSGLGLLVPAAMPTWTPAAGPAWARMRTPSSASR
jgi:hypothetical protein